MTKYRGWVGYEANEARSVPAMLSAYCLMFDNFDLSRGLRAGYLKQLHKACTLNVGMRNAKTAPGDLRYLESAYTFHAGVTTMASLEELFELRRNDQSPLFFTKGYDKTAEELDVRKVYNAIQKLGELKYRPWYPPLTERQKDSLDRNGTRIFDCSFEEFYETKHYIQMQYALKLDEILDEFNTTMPQAGTEDEKLLAISKVIRKLELLHAFPDGNGRTYVSALMNHLLLYYGFYPAILYNPNWDAELSFLEWVEEMKRGMDNTRMLLRNPRMRLHNYSIDDADDESIAAFLEMTVEFGKKLDALCDATKAPAQLADRRPADASAPVQRLLGLLRQCDAGLVEEDGGLLRSDAFEPQTGTLSATVDCSKLDGCDLGAFAAVRHIRGDLIVAGPVSRLDGLDNLVSVSGKLAFDGLGIDSLGGLSRLEAAGTIVVSGMSRLTSLNGFTSLLNVRNDVRITGNPRLADINGFNALTSIGGSLVIAGNGCLSSINGLNAVRQTVKGSLEIRDNPALWLINGLRFLQRIGDTLVVSGCRQLVDFGFLAGLEQARYVTINETGLRDGAALGRLFGKSPAFPGAIRITGNPDLTSVNFLAGLRSVASSLYLHQNRLASLDGLECLESVGASFTLSANELSDLAPLSKLKHVGGVISLSNNRLRSLKGLESLQYVKTSNWNGARISLKLSGNRDGEGRISLTDISALANLKEAEGQLIIVADGNHDFMDQPPRDSAFFSNKIEIVAQQ